jgi:hypothetical protein
VRASYTGRYLDTVDRNCQFSEPQPQSVAVPVIEPLLHGGIFFALEAVSTWGPLE